MPVGVRTSALLMLSYIVFSLMKGRQALLDSTFVGIKKVFFT